ncbi:MAG: spermidine synthase [Acidobacteriia bacterium]|nr:spermidine synthase [Terriglobia bacterium]
MDLRAELWIGIFFLLFLLVGARARRRQEPFPWIYVLFFCSGFPALIYQIVWQRALFGIYGVNIESVTIVVSAFMFGLGLGSLIGGVLSKNARLPLLVLFALAELGTAAFGLVSLRLFHHAAEYTAGSPTIETGLVSFALVVVPTVLMGATLPLLVEHLVRTSRNVGFVVGGLYFVNTLGSAAACFVAGDALMRLLGQSGSVRFAAAINAIVGTAVLIYSLVGKANVETTPPLHPETGNQLAPEHDRVLPFPLALACATFAGFLALSYEIIWYRLLAFASGGVARVFALLLGSYLLGVALGSRIVERYSEGPGMRNRQASLRLLGWVMLASALFSFAIGPIFAFLLKFGAVYVIGGANLQSYLLFLPLICAGALFFGATFPLISHVSVRADDRAGAALSYLYAANIIGSTLGSFVVGFILMDHFSLLTISTVLLAVGLLFALGVLTVSDTPRSRLKAAVAFGLVTASIAVVVTRPVFDTIYDRLLFKMVYPRFHFQHVVETRSGVVGVTPDGTVYGGGVYDGHFNIGLGRDVNMVTRAYAISAFHPAPRHVLMIGLASGSWAQVVANNPEVEDLTIVEINPAYLQLIPQYPEVASLLHNPKVRIEIDDGRRWLLRNRNATFDVIVMNTTFYWRDHSTNLLSSDFLQMVRAHLNPGGMLFYNPTGSNDVMATGLAVFPYALRFMNCLVVSDVPIVFDRERWRTVLLNYTIDGKHVIGSPNQPAATELDHLLDIPVDPTGKLLFSIEENDQLRRRLQHLLIFTDDNMGLEWRG